MNLNDFALLKEDHDSYTIGHPAGKSLRVPKKGLSDKAHVLVSKLKKEQHFDVGGAAQSESQPLEIEPIEEPASSQAPQSVDMSNPDPLAGIQDANAISDQNISASQEAAANNSAPQQPQVGNPIAAYPDTNAPIDTAIKAIQGGAAAQGQAGKEVSNLTQGYSKDIGTMETPEQILARGNQQDEAFKAYLQDPKNNINPDHYYQNRSAAQNVATAIGMILSGFGSGKTGQPNLAAKMADDAINRDIDAQKNNQNKEMSLWQMNRAKTHSDLEANLVTRNQMLNVLETQIKGVQAKYASPEATARAAQIVLPLEQEKLMNNYKRGILQQTSGNGVSQMEPERAVPLLVPQEHQKQVFTEINQAKAAANNEDNMLRTFDQAAKDTRPATGLSATSMLNAIPGYHPVSVKNLNLLADPLIHDNEGRINELEQQHVQQNFPQFGDSDETVAKKRAALQEFINHKKSAPTANAFGINLNNFASTRGAPQAPIVKTQNGIRYMKVPGGWQKIQ